MTGWFPPPRFYSTWVGLFLVETCADGTSNCHERENATHGDYLRAGIHLDKQQIGCALIVGQNVSSASPWRLGVLRALRTERLRRAALRTLVMDLGMNDFRERHPDSQLSPVLVLIASYQEAENIGAVLDAVPRTVHGLDVSTLVIVDGGDDDTPKIVNTANAYCAVLPVNMGQGVALRLGYEIAIAGGCQYVVTLDADGQNDPGEMADLLKPIIDDKADFVIGSRRLGTDETSDRLRKSGVVVFAEIINRLGRQDLTDTSNGFRAFRSAVIADLTLEQDQYQTAEVILAAAARGWRIAECPTVWRPRSSGESKKGHNLWFGLQYARVIASTWLRERRR